MRRACPYRGRAEMRARGRKPCFPQLLNRSINALYRGKRFFCKDVQVIVHKLTILRLSEATYGEEHSKMTAIKSEIRKHEASLLEIIKLDRTINRRANPFRRVPANELS